MDPPSRPRQMVPVRDELPVVEVTGGELVETAR
jgi:hypothetical protein